jgi:hypothetical protein
MPKSPATVDGREVALERRESEDEAAERAGEVGETDRDESGVCHESRGRQSRREKAVREDSEREELHPLEPLEDRPDEGRDLVAEERDPDDDQSLVRRPVVDEGQRRREGDRQTGDPEAGQEDEPACEQLRDALPIACDLAHEGAVQAPVGKDEEQRDEGDGEREMAELLGAQGPRDDDEEDEARTLAGHFGNQHPERVAGRAPEARLRCDRALARHPPRADAATTHVLFLPGAVVVRPLPKEIAIMWLGS